MVRVSEDAGIYDLPDDVMAERLSDEPGGDADVPCPDQDLSAVGGCRRGARRER
jgi:hypothetical protein